MPFSNDPNRSGPLAAAREALEAGDLATATRRVAAVLGEDPNRADALALLDEIITAAPDPLALVPEDDLPLPSNLQAVQAYILADQGRLPEAVEKLLGVIVDRPDVLTIDWLLGWLQKPEAAGQLSVERFVTFLHALHEQYPALTAPHGGGRDTLARLPLFIQLVRRTQPAHAGFLSAAAALLSRMGNLDEALRLAREAYALEPDLATASVLVATHLARQEVEPALKVYQEAIARDPTDVALRLALADLLAHRDRLKEAMEVYAEILEQDPNQEVARPSLYFLRYVTEEDETWRDRLFALAEEQPDNERAQRLAQQLTPYLGHLPPPPDVTAKLRKPPGDSGRRAELPYLEAPSNYLAFGWLANLDVSVARTQQPDPRLPRRRVDYLLWTYEGNRPHVAVAPPDPEVSQAIARLAAQPYHLESWSNLARHQAQLLGAEKLDDVLATLVYPPGVGQADRPGLWTYRVQVAAALVLAYLDEGWEGSVRRKALLALANGPMDWTVDAALVALAAVAREESQAASEIVALFRELRKQAGQDGPFTWLVALLWCALLLPDLPAEEREDLRGQLRAHEDARRAERHQRQAQAHLEKGDVDAALAALSETVRLDPRNADALRERAALLLRRGEAARAVTDYSEALRLQPDLSGIHLGRGQAHPKLGKLGPAIDDFSEAIRLTPWEWQPWYRRGLVHMARKEHEQAVQDFSEAIRLAPELTEPYLQRALANTRLGRDERAIGDYTELVRLNPQSALAYNFRGRLHLRQGNAAAALADHLRASELDPGNANTYSQLAWIWATSPDAAVRDAGRALEAARKACELTEWKKAHCLDAFAAANAEAGRFAEAVQYAEQALGHALEVEKRAYAEHLRAYQAGQPWREKTIC